MCLDAVRTNIWALSVLALNIHIMHLYITTGNFPTVCLYRVSKKIVLSEMGLLGAFKASIYKDFNDFSLH